MTQSWNLPVLAGDKVSSAMLSKINDGFEALRTIHGGASAPTATVAYMLWLEEAADREIYQRNAGDSAWQAILAANAKNHADEYWLEFLAGLAGAGNFPLHMPGQNWKADELVIMSDTATTGSAAGVTDWVFQIQNITTGNYLFSSAPTTGNTEIPSKSVWSASCDQNQAVSKDDYLELQITQNGTPTSLAAAALKIGIRGHLTGA